MSSLISGYSIYCSFYSAKSSDATGDDQVKYSASRVTIDSPQHNQQHIFAAKKAKRTPVAYLNYTFSKSVTDFTYTISPGSFLTIDTAQSEKNIFAGTVQGKSPEIRMRSAIGAGNFR